MCLARLEWSVLVSSSEWFDGFESSLFERFVLFVIVSSKQNNPTINVISTSNNLMHLKAIWLLVVVLSCSWLVISEAQAIKFFSTLIFSRMFRLTHFKPLLRVTFVHSNNSFGMGLNYHFTSFLGHNMGQSVGVQAS